MIDGQDYQRREAIIGDGLMVLVARMMRKFGIPLTRPDRRRFAQRLLPEVLTGRAQSYVLATHYLDYGAEVARQPLPTIAPIAPYDADALVQVLERTTAPVERLVAAVEQEHPGLTIHQAVESAQARRSVVTITDLRTGQPIPVDDLDNDPSDPRVIVRIARNTGAAVARHADQAGRDAVLRTAAGAGHRVGWARVTKSAKPCAFCAMLASRGPVYRSERSANFRAHDHCTCWATIVYAGQPWDGQVEFEHWQSVWATTTRGLSGREARAAFRRKVEGRTHQHGHRGNAGRPRRETAAPHRESAAAIAQRHLPTLEKTLSDLRSRGFTEDSRPVQYHLGQIERHRGALAHH